MVERRQFVGHSTTAEANLFTGLDREITIDEQTSSIRVHDGVTQGGFAMARSDLANVNVSSLNSLLTGKEDNSNKVTSISSSSTDQEYPSARAVWKLLAELAELGELKLTTRQTLDSTCAYWNGDMVYRSEAQDMYELLAAGTFPTVSLEKFDSLVEEFGYCAYYGLDLATQSFRMPKVEDCYIKFASGLPDGVKQAIPNLKCTVNNFEAAATVTSENELFEVTNLGGNGAGGSGGRHKNWRFVFDASKLYPNLFKDDVTNLDVNSVKVRAYSRIKYPAF